MVKKTDSERLYCISVLVRRNTIAITKHQKERTLERKISSPRKDCKHMKNKNKDPSNEASL